MHMFYLINLASVHLGSLKDTSHVLLWSLENLAQDKTFAESPLQIKKKKFNYITTPDLIILWSFS